MTAHMVIIKAFSGIIVYDMFEPFASWKKCKDTK